MLDKPGTRIKSDRPPFDVVVVGAVGMEPSVYLYGNDVDFSIECNFSRNLECLGQAGGYAGRHYAAMGKRVALIGFVGDDYHGFFTRRELNRDGIDTSGLFTDPAGTKRSITFMYRDGRRKNFYDGKGSMETSPDIKTCRRILRGSRFAHFSVVNWTRDLLPVAKELGVTIACDLQDIPSAEDEYRQDFVDLADIILFSCANHRDPEPLFRDFLGRRPELLLVCGMGAKGCATANSVGIRHYPPLEMQKPVIDTNGAGNGLAAGFLSSFLLDGFELEEAVLRGQIVARHTCAVEATTALTDLMSGERLHVEFEARTGNADMVSSPRP